MALNDSARGRGKGTRRMPPRLEPNVDLMTARLNKGWGVNELARMARLHGNTVLAAEKGFYVEPHSQNAMARALDKPVLELFPLSRQKEFWK